jgi:hypothetical protein
MKMPGIMLLEWQKRYGAEQANQNIDQSEMA